MANDAVQFRFIAHTMVEEFILPEVRRGGRLRQSGTGTEPAKRQ
jgi:hypothetical protein